MKGNLIEQISIFLLKNQFTLRVLTRTCFDLVARKESNILFLKIIEDANSVSKEIAGEMRKISSYFNASSLILAEKAGSLLQDNVVYSRFDVYCLNLGTFQNCVENKFPFVRRSRAGLVANISGDKLRKMREQEGLSLNSLAKKIGVSSRMVVKYEQGVSEITFRRALRIYDLFGGNVFNKINIFTNEFNLMPDSRQTIVEKKYSELGFDVNEMHKVPFDLIAKKEDDVILTEIGDKVNLQFQSLGKIIDADNLVIFNKKKPKDIPAVSKEEFLDFNKSKELIKFVKEF